MLTFKYKMVQYYNGQDHRYDPDHSKTEPHKGIRDGCHFGWIWNGQSVQIQNDIQIPNHSTSELLSTIYIPNVFAIQPLTVTGLEVI